MSIITVLALFLIPSVSFSAVEFIYSPKCIEHIVARKKNIKLDDSIPRPNLYLASNTPLISFQDAIEKQWGTRPDFFLNAYAIDRNEIYLIDDAEHHMKSGTTVDQAYAHEFTHYLQHRYQNYDLYNDESAEPDAKGVEFWFRDNYMLKPDVSICKTFGI